MVHHLQSCLKVLTLRLFFPFLYAIKHFAIVHLPQCDVGPLHAFFFLHQGHPGREGPPGEKGLQVGTRHVGGVPIAAS